MKPSVLGALTGAMTGLVAVLLQYLVVLQSGFLRALLFPGFVFIRYANTKGFGDFGLMFFDFFAYFSNILLYAAIGWLLGSLLDRPERGGEERKGASHDGPA